MKKPGCEGPHDWRPMLENEAYPASSGRVCKVCDLYELGWFCDINEAGGEELNKKIVESLNRKKKDDRI
jgi:hypothetical protein